MKRQAKEKIEQKLKKKYFRQKQLANNPRFKQEIEAAKSQNQIKKFFQLKFENQTYRIGDILIFQNPSQKEDYHVAQLLGIYILPDNIQKFPLLQIKWCYNKKDLPSKYQNQLEFISHSEIFPTQHIDYIYIDLLKSKAKLFTQQQFEILPYATSNKYFTRANFNIQNDEIEPPTSTWKTSCICNKPLNPDLLYIECDKCKKWYHAKCYSIDSNDISELSNFECRCSYS